MRDSLPLIENITSLQNVVLHVLEVSRVLASEIFEPLRRAILGLVQVLG